MISLNDYIKLLLATGFRIDDFYSENEEEFDEYGEKHLLFVTTVTKE